MILFLLAAACAPKVAEEIRLAPPDAAPSMAEARSSGVVYEGVFTDEMHAFSLPVMEGWVAVPGPETGLMRVAMTHVATSTRIEVWAFPGEGLEPRVREGCQWSFKEKNRPLPFANDVLMATCAPDDPLGRRVYGVIFSKNGSTYQIEVQPPNDALLEGRMVASDLLEGFGW